MADLQLSKEDRDATILRLWAEGKTSGQIAMQLCITRNIAMGIVHRARIKGMSVDPKGHHDKYAFGGHKGLERARKLAKTPKPVGPGSGRSVDAPPSVAPLAAGPVKLFPSVKADNTVKASKRNGVPIYRLRVNGCKFPVGVNAKGEHVFCNDPSHKRDYCQAHYEVCFVPPTRENTRRVMQTWVK